MNLDEIKVRAEKAIIEYKGGYGCAASRFCGEDVPALIAEVERLQGELIGRDIAFRETLKECKEVGFTDPALINIQAELRKKLAAIRKAAKRIVSQPIYNLVQWQVDALAEAIKE